MMELVDALHGVEANDKPLMQRYITEIESTLRSKDKFDAILALHQTL